jgi:hypothetical protein
MAPTHCWHLIQPFPFPIIPLPHLGCEWLEASRTFLKDCHASLEIPKTPLPQLCCQHDQCIMESFIPPELSPAAIGCLNCCRLWLRVTLLGNMCTLLGDSVKRAT